MEATNMSDWNKIRQAYEQAQPLYRQAWALDQAKAMHYGYWDQNTSNLRQALHRLNERLAEMAQPQEGLSAVDAGCGVGGTALFLGETQKAKVLGISLGPKEIEQARKYAQQAGFSEQQLSFQVGNYLNLPAADNSFDQVWAIESLFHCADKKAFLTEARRVLRPGGKLVLADYYTARKKRSQKMNRWMQEWKEGYEVPQLYSWKQFTALAEAQGFALVVQEDASEAVKPSAKRLSRWGQWGLFYLKLFGWLHRHLFPQYPLDKAQVRSTVSQYKALKARCWAYHLSVWERL